jgi:hypothetical protein
MHKQFVMVDTDLEIQLCGHKRVQKILGSHGDVSYGMCFVVGHLLKDHLDPVQCIH